MCNPCMTLGGSFSSLSVFPCFYEVFTLDELG